jgi:hypothetical protein
VACDGRWSIAHRQPDLPLTESPVPIDAWWFRLPRAPEDRSAAATLLAEPLRRGALRPAELAAVRARRIGPTVLVQASSGSCTAVWWRRSWRDAG